MYSAVLLLFNALCAIINRVNNLTKKICINAVIAGLYAALTLLLAPISFGPLQLRVAEALTILPALMPFSVWGVAVGCLISNIFYPLMGIYDVIFGTLITLAAALLTSRLKNMWIAPLPPVLLNAFLLPLVWYFALNETAYWLNVLTIFAGQTLALYAVGIPLYAVMKRSVLPLIFKEN